MDRYCPRHKFAAGLHDTPELCDDRKSKEEKIGDISYANNKDYKSNLPHFQASNAQMKNNGMNG